MKIGIITFHASFNYGSMLQAYALLRVLENMGHDTEIINFRSHASKQLYHYPINFNIKGYSKIRLLLYYLKHLPNYIREIKKWNLYNNFLNEDLKITKEFNTIDQLKHYDFGYDSLFIGSDQIWNINCEDFSDAFCGNFVDRSTKKIAYAPSMGPCPEILDASYFKKNLINFHALSVREPRSRDVLIDNGICTKVSLTLDPTLLLKASDYEGLYKKEPLINGDYIYFYDPFVRPQNLRIALEIGKKRGCKVIVDRQYQKGTYKDYKNVIFYTKVGPREFLNLIKNAKLVIAHSLHAVIFSIIFRKDFYAIDGDKDSRINYLLNTLGLQNRAINVETHTIIDDTSIKTYDSVFEKYDLLKKDSISFITKSLNS